MPNSALPDHLKNTIPNGDGTDWDFWPFKYIPRGWTAYGWRATQSWARWRQFPFLIFGINVNRFMSGLNREIHFNHKRVKCLEKYTYFGPSPLQKFSKWGVMLTWPFYFCVWYQFERQIAGEGTEKVAFFRIGAYWDSNDSFYAFPSAFIGLHWS